MEVEVELIKIDMCHYNERNQLIKSLPCIVIKFIIFYF
jgi:hypothetical protein